MRRVSLVLILITGLFGCISFTKAQRTNIEVEFKNKQESVPSEGKENK